MQRLGPKDMSGNDDKIVNTHGSGGPMDAAGDKSKGEDGGPDEFDKQVEVKQSCFRRLRKKCCSKDPAKKPVGVESNPNLRVKNTIKRIVNGRFVLTLMTFVTIFALIGVSAIIVPKDLEFQIFEPSVSVSN